MEENIALTPFINSGTYIHPPMVKATVIGFATALGIIIVVGTYLLKRQGLLPKTERATFGFLFSLIAALLFLVATTIENFLWFHPAALSLGLIYGVLGGVGAFLMLTTDTKVGGGLVLLCAVISSLIAVPFWVDKLAWVEKPLFSLPYFIAGSVFTSTSLGFLGGVCGLHKK